MKILRSYLSPGWSIGRNNAVVWLQLDDGSKHQVSMHEPAVANYNLMKVPPGLHAEARQVLVREYRRLHEDPEALAHAERVRQGRKAGVRKNQVMQRKKKIKKIARDLMQNFSVDQDELRALLDEVLVETVQES